MAENSNISVEGCIEFANKLIELCGLTLPRISSIQNINSDFLVTLFEHITGFTVPDILLGNDSITEVHNIQAVIDTLALDLLNISLSHITGEDIADGNIISIMNLLELFQAVFLYLFPDKEKHLNDPCGTSSGEDSLRNASAIEKAESSKPRISSTEKSAPSASVLKRKTCKDTLRKFHQNPHIPKKKMRKAPQSETAELTHSKGPDTIDAPVKTISKHPSRIVKQLDIKSIEQLYNLNLEKKVRALLYCNKSPIRHAQQMKKNYIQSLKTPLRKTSIPSCKKSFLLPQNLRHKGKLSVRQSSVAKRTSPRKKSVKQSISENNAKSKKGDDIPAIFQTVLEEFPGFKFPKNTMDLLTKNYHQHLGQMHKQLNDVFLKKPVTLIQTEKETENQIKLSKILDKDLKEKNYLRELNEQRNMENKIKGSFRDARLRSAKTRQYFEEFHKSMSKKLQKRNFSEEVLVEKTFKEILDIQKEKVRLLCQKVKETDKQDAKQHRQYLNALRNLYQEQLALLAESLNTEQKDSSEREKAQKLAVEKMNREFRKKLQKEVRCLQKDVLKLIEDIHFRELDAQNFIIRFQQTS